MRLTKIVATLGPASQTPAVLAALVRAGLDIARLNFSHGDGAGHARLARRFRAAARAAGRPVALLQDLQGPRIRLGELPSQACAADGNLRLEEGSAVILGGDCFVAPSKRGAAIVLPTTFPALARDLARGDRLLLRDGRVELVVERVRGATVCCAVRRGGDVRSHSGINAPDSRLRVPALTAKDRRDLDHGVRIGVDAVALSFVRDAADVRRARAELASRRSHALIVAKIERREALEKLDEILVAADGVMVARGDLGVELGPEAVPLLQKEIIRRAIRAHSFVITATQMLESMTASAVPTRAEVSDVANALLDGTDAVMLSGETATGSFPVEAVAAMDRIARHVEQRCRHGRSPEFVSVGAPSSAPTSAFVLPPPIAPDDFVYAIADAAVQLAEQSGARAIVPFTASGRTASIVATFRPQLPILAFSPDAATLRRLCFWRGVHPRLLCKGRNLAELFASGVEDARRAGILQPGDAAVLIGGHALARGSSNTLQLVRVAAPAVH